MPEEHLLVHVIPDTANAGAENQARYLIGAQAASPEFNVEIIYFREGAVHSEFQQLGLPLRQLSTKLGSPYGLPQMAVALHRAYRDRAPTILHTWLPEANFVGALAASRWPATGLIAGQRSGNLERGMMRVRHGSRVIRARADHVIANSTEGKELLVDLGYDQERIAVIRNGFPQPMIDAISQADERGRIRDQLGIRGDTPVVGYVGRVDPAKDLDTLFAAMSLVWSELPSATLMMVGPHQHELRRFGISQPEAVRALGWVTPAWRVMPAFDVLACSSWTEGFSNAVCEALLAGVPAACTDTGDHAQVVRRAGGEVVPIRDPGRLGMAIVALLRARPGRREVGSAAARELSMDAVVTATEDVYRRALERRRHRR
jgi:glycosyltransferase involved in cell wall biosynthesis